MNRMLLHQGKILLRSWQPDDAQWYVHARDEQVFAWATERRHLTVAETDHAIQNLQDSDDVVSFAIAEREIHTLLGTIALARDTTRPQTLEVMYWLAPHGRGRGVATTAVQLVIAWAFRTLKR